MTRLRAFGASSGQAEALVIGAGPAGLATSRELSRAGIRHIVLERGGLAGQTWVDLYDGLVLHTARGLSALPGQPFPTGTPRFPTRRDFVTYLQEYAAAFSVPLRTNADVIELRRDANAWRARLACGEELAARSVVVATGILSNPHSPQLPGRERFHGRLMHSVEYRRPQPFAGQRVLVIGAGNSGADIATELADAGVSVVLAGRSGASMVPLTIAGIPSHYFGFALASLRRKTCARVPVVGMRLASALRRGTIQWRTKVTELTASGARCDDGEAMPIDTVILATGYRPAIGFLKDLVRCGECGFPERHGGVASANQRDLYFVGHQYDSRGALYNIGRDAALAAALVGAPIARTWRDGVFQIRPV
ncbi:MAG TPA: NAD(P)/FAD-dependent oxidoreductase [Vicinamibacterales bacterium]|nr:NAD(P)/FAD-dependent oxidoreductase [Vicinamibacterales bacterium]